jgi:uncharacterized repeat protein (TIGR01451 family)
MIQTKRLLVLVAFAMVGAFVLGESAGSTIGSGFTISVQEMASFTGTVTSFDPAAFGAPDCSGFSATIDWGDGTQIAATITANGSVCDVSDSGGIHSYAEDGSYVVTVSVTPSGGSAVSYTGTADVGESTLSLSSVSVSAVEGAVFSGKLATFSDPGSPDPGSSYTATIDWGDGSPTSAGTLTATGGGNFTVTGSHTYLEEISSGSFSLTVAETGQPNFSLTVGNVVSVTDAPLSASGTTLSASAGVVFTGKVASFTDADPNGMVSDYTATIDWGDGSAPSIGTVSANASGGFDVTGSHTYAASGTFTVTTQSQDAGGASAPATTKATVLNADVAVSLGASPNPVKSGSSLTYTVVVKNGGPGASTLAVSDPLPAQAQFQSLTAPGFNCLAPAVGTSGTLTCTMAGLANGATATITVVVKVVAPGKSTISNTTSVNAGSSDPNPANNTATVTTSVYGRH